VIPAGRTLLLSERVKAVMVCLPVLRSSSMKCFPRLPLAYGLLDMRGVVEERFAYTNDGHLLEMTSLCHD
jgi:hypothetical protein